VFIWNFVPVCDFLSFAGCTSTYLAIDVGVHHAMGEE
jgi:hypothetical protein